jgi:hypothetical protein
MDRSAWRLAINVPEPWPLFVFVPFMFLYVSPCFSSLLGFISSLPQLAWNKMLCCCCWWYLKDSLRVQLTIYNAIKHGLMFLFSLIGVLRHRLPTKRTDYDPSCLTSDQAYSIIFPGNVHATFFNRLVVQVSDQTSHTVLISHRGVNKS